MKILTILCLLSMACCFKLNGQQVLRQSSSHQGLNASASLGYYSWNIDDIFEDAEGGFIFGLDASYGIKEWVAPFISVGIAPGISPSDPDEVLENYSLAHFQIGARFTPGQTTAQFRPFFGVSYEFNSATQDAYVDDGFGNVFIVDDLKVQASGLGLEGGAMYYFQTDLAVKGHVHLGFGSTDSVESASAGLELLDDYDYSNFQIGLGILYNIAL